MTARPNAFPTFHHEDPARSPARGAASAPALSVLALTPPGGASGARTRHLLELSRGLDGLGDRFRGISIADTPRTVPHVAHRGAHPRLATSVAAILRALLDEPTDIVQCPSIRTTYAAALAVFAAGMRYPRRRQPALITTLPFLSRVPHDDFYRRAARHLRLLSDGVIVATSAARAALLAHQFPPDRVAVVAPIQDLRACLHAAEHGAPSATIPGVPPKARVVLTISRPAPRSGLAYLLGAWPLVARAVPDAYLVVATSGNTGIQNPITAHQLTDDTCAEPGPVDRIVFTGTRIPIPMLLTRAQVVAQSVMHAGPPDALLQALAARRPVVASATGGIPDLIAHEETGLLVPPCDCPALAAAIQRLLDDQTLAHHLANAGHQHVRQRYTRPALVAATRAAYLQALDRVAARAAALMPYDL